jgi:hypothetical protein
VRSIDPLLPLTQVQTMEQVVSESEASRRFNTALISSFAFAAVLLAVLGIYSVIAFSVASRVQEMAIRMTLGSRCSAVGFATFAGICQNVLPVHLVIHRVETKVGRFLRFCV